ncbi:FAD-dependent oxidoreductase [bacterium]|nr:FAD-dependent oxidoreductase [bacterium]
MKTNTLSLGAGLTGLSAAYHSKGRDFLVVEKSDHVGGICTSEHKNGFVFDQTGHWFHVKTSEVRSLMTRLFGQNTVEIERKTFVFSHNVFTQYPFQSNTFGLPPQVIKECVLGFVKAYYENDKSRAHENFYEWCMAYLGEGISRHFMIPYNTKIYTVHPKDYASHWCDYYVPKPTLEQVIEGAVTAPEQKNIGYNAKFFYPKENGIGELPERLFDRCEKEKFIFSAEPVSIDAAKKLVKLSNGTEIEYETLINTIPLNKFLKLLTNLAELPAHEIADRMKIAHVSYFNAAFKKPCGHPGHWFYIPEEKFMPYRVGSFSNIYNKLAPVGKGSAYIEFTHQEESIDTENFRRKSIELLLAMGLISTENDIEFMDYCKIDAGYVIYHKEYFDDMALIEKWCAQNSVRLAGRYGKWTYSAMEDAILDGMKAVKSD